MSSTKSNSGQTTYQRQLHGKKSTGKLQANHSIPKEKSENTEKKRQEGDQIDEIFGFERYKKVMVCLSKFIFRECRGDVVLVCEG